MRIEFKPFIFPDDQKIVEIFQTVAAFANTEGGQVFLGIDDHGELIGVGKSLQKWAAATPDESSCKRYVSEIRKMICGELHSDVPLEFSQTVVDGQMIVILEVAESKKKPVTFKRERTNLYLRRGANNVRAAPEEWSAISTSPSNGTMPGWLTKL